MNEPARDSSPQYSCPMHPEVRQKEPGTCPKCGMRLEPTSGAAPADGDAHAADHLEMIRDMRAAWLWTNATIMALGLWLLSSPFTFGYTKPAMIWSDVASGLLLAIFAGIAFVLRFDVIGRWSVCLIGVWLQFAPLVFWAPDATVYLNDTIVGAFAITLSVLVPMMPGMAHHMVMMQPGPDVPPGWTYNPSAWHQRAPLVALGFIGWLISRYLAAFQLGYIDRVWEPFFNDGTRQVLTSEVSKMWPISDAGLGAAAYTFEFLMAWMGGRARWRTMPWMVVFFFILVVPLGLTHIILVILQPVAVGAWCTLCLAAAAVMLAMIPLTVDEVIAMGQFLIERVRAGKPLWRTFWVGDTMPGGAKDDRSPRYGSRLRQQLPAAAWGVSVPWTLFVVSALGIWLMAAPAMTGSSEAAADSDHLVGAIVLTIAAISTAEVVRALRFLNVLLGIWLVIAPWMLTGATTSSRWSNLLAGLAIAALSLPRGPVREHYAAWDRFVV